MTVTKTIAVFGGSRGVGREFVQQALELGHHIRALVRAESTSAPLTEHKNLTVIRGDATSPDAVLETLQGCSTVFHSVGPTSYGAFKTHVTLNTQVAIGEAVKRLPKGQIEKVILISALASTTQAPMLVRFGYNYVLSDLGHDKSSAEQKLQELGGQAGVTWTIIRPSALSDRPLAKRCKAGETLYPGLMRFTIGRADVAYFALDKVVGGTEWDNKAVSISC